MSKEIKFEDGSGNVFLDIGFSEEEAKHELLRSNLAFEVYRLLEEQKLTPSKAEARFGLDPSDVSRIQNGEFEEFSVEQLFMLLNQLNCIVEIRITPADKTGDHQRVVSV